MSRELIWSATKKDFKIDWFSGTGAGGQHRNKHQNCCRITHIETGKSATCQEHKSARQNKKVAFNRLVKLLVNHYFQEDNVSRAPPGAMGQKYNRTYKETDNTVIDHLTKKKFSFKETVGKGDISELINARIKGSHNG